MEYSFGTMEVLLLCPFSSLLSFSMIYVLDVKIIMTRYHALWLDPKGPFWFNVKIIIFCNNLVKLTSNDSGQYYC